jgi:AcrR family transcriptional regulator
MSSTPSSSTHSVRLGADARRKQLIEIATRLFATKGFSATTTREIAAAAGVNEAIIFRFFPHKDDLYAAILDAKSDEARTDSLVEELRAAAADHDDRRVIRTTVRSIVERLQRDPEFLRLMLHSALEGHSFAAQFRERHNAPLRRFLLEYVTGRQREGVFRAGDPEPLVRAILAVPVHHAMIETLMPPENRVQFHDDVIESYVTFVLHGLSAGQPGNAARTP